MEETNKEGKNKEGKKPFSFKFYGRDIGYNEITGAFMALIALLFVVAVIKTLLR